MSDPHILPSQLIALAWVARTGSLTAASRALGKTQPAVSAQLKSLQRSSGAPLVIRHRYGVTLTPAGVNLLTYAEACVRAVDGAQQAAARMKGLEHGTLRVLASASVAAYLLPSPLSDFHAQFPGIELVLTRHTAADAMFALERGDGDVAVVRGLAATMSPGFASNFITAVVATDDTVLVVPTNHPLAKRKQVPWKDLHGLEVIGRESSSATQALIEKLCSREKLQLKVKFRTSGVEALKEAIIRGLGAGFLPELAVKREVDTGVLAAVRVVASELVQRITVAYPSLGQCAPTVPRFVDVLASRLASPNLSAYRVLARVRKSRA